MYLRDNARNPSQSLALVTTHFLIPAPPSMCVHIYHVYCLCRVNRIRRMNYACETMTPCYRVQKHNHADLIKTDVLWRSELISFITFTLSISHIDAESFEDFTTENKIRENNYNNFKSATTIDLIDRARTFNRLSTTGLSLNAVARRESEFLDAKVRRGSSVHHSAKRFRYYKIWLRFCTKCESTNSFSLL